MDSEDDTDEVAAILEDQQVNDNEWVVGAAATSIMNEKYHE